MERARTLLAAGGFALRGHTLVLGRRPVQLGLDVASASPFAADEVAAVTAACRSLGITVVASRASVAAAGSAVRARRYDLAIVTVTLPAWP